jgi:SAM-dependent methyltransferase
MTDRSRIDGAVGAARPQAIPQVARPGDPRAFSPASQRNRQPILEVLARVLPGSGLVLEVASGGGEHALWFAQHLRPLAWQPSDPDPACRRSIAAHAAGVHCPTLKPPLDLDVTEAIWPIEHADAIVCINMVHIVPWAATEGLIAGAARCLPPGGVLYLYGPYKRVGKHTAPSNAAFDESLRAHDPAWGLREVEAVAESAQAQGLTLGKIVEMPANNLSLVLTRT